MFEQAFRNTDDTLRKEAGCTTEARSQVNSHFTMKQQVFLDFVLSHYISVGVEELVMEKLTPLLWLKYKDSIPDAVSDLGEAQQIRNIFTSFQRFLYQSSTRSQQTRVDL